MAHKSPPLELVPLYITATVPLETRSGTQEQATIVVSFRLQTFGVFGVQSSI